MPTPAGRRAPLLGGVVVVIFSVVTALVAGCGAPLPRDTDGSLERITGGVLRVGVSDNPPWVEVHDGAAQAGRPAADTHRTEAGEVVSGREVDLLSGFGREREATVRWVPGAESELIEAMARGELDVMVGGLTTDSPWSKEVALTRPYAEDVPPDGDTVQRVMATPLGENALLVALETHLARVGGVT